MRLRQPVIFVPLLAQLSQASQSSSKSTTIVKSFASTKKTSIHNSYFIDRIRGGHQPSSTSSLLSNKNQSGVDSVERSSHKMDGHNTPINFVFSDVDGTLVHYPLQQTTTQEDDNDIIHLPPSSTGMRGVISSKTLKLCQILRNEHNVKLVLVSGMRTSTLLKRLPYLPKADAYASEAGGRIFYPETDLDQYTGTVIEPVPFSAESDTDLKKFGLVEDMEWRNELSSDHAAGTDGYIGDVMNEFLNLDEKDDIQEIPIQDRKGALWDFAKGLEKEGFILDHKGYSCCFRVNRKQQVNANINDEDFDRLSRRDVSKLGLASSVNLGCIDFYPKSSGKKNCCSYLAKIFATKYDSTMTDLNGDDILLQRALCICDDDNDLEMASACGRVFLPSVSSESMEKAAASNPEKIMITENKEVGIVETLATELALMKAINLLRERSLLRP